MKCPSLTYAAWQNPQRPIIYYQNIQTLYNTLRAKPNNN